MKNTQTLLEEAKAVMAKELLSCRHVDFNSATGKRLRRTFTATCVDKIGTPFIDSIAGIKETEPVNMFT